MRNLTRWTGGAALLAAVLLAGTVVWAADAPEARKPWIVELEKAVKARWLGKSESAVTERLGPPKNRHAQDKIDFVTWSAVLNFGSRTTLECQADISFEADKLTDVLILGEDQGLCRKLLHPLLTDAGAHP